MGGAVHVNCPLCGRDEPDRLFTATDRLGLSEGGHTVVECRACGMAYLDPRPDDDELMRAYPAEYWGGRVGGPAELLRAVEERLKEGYKLTALRRAGIAPCRLLDVGCGRGEFIRMLADRGYEVAGLEPGEQAAKRGRQETGLDIKHGTLGNVRLPAESFDAVTMWHVLEHLPDPSGALAEAAGLLAPGGTIVVALPDFGGWQARRFREDWFGVDAPRHLTHFTRETLTKMLERSGFAVKMAMPGGARYETAMLVRSMFPGLNRLKLDALEAGRASKYAYKALQLVLDIALLPAGFALTASGSAGTLVAAAVKTGGHGE